MVALILEIYLKNRTFLEWNQKQKLRPILTVLPTGTVTGAKSCRFCIPSFYSVTGTATGAEFYVRCMIIKFIRAR